MMDGTVSHTSIDSVISTFDGQYRLNFKDLIREAKLLTHKCQFLCYQNKTELVDAEECARNCFKPLLYSKKNISTLIENKKENFEKCRFVSESKNKENSVNLREITKCLGKYKEEMEGIKEEIEYIYKGYMKNYDVLLIELENPIKKQNLN